MNATIPDENIKSVTKRLQSELMNLLSSPTTGISAFPETGNLLKWVATITGPHGTPYHELEYKLTFEFPLVFCVNQNYPYSPPTVRFDTQMFHPNVDLAQGTICLDILKDKWSAVYNVQTILLSLQSLLGEPNNDSPLNIEAAQLWNNQLEFKKQVAKWHPGNE